MTKVQSSKSKVQGNSFNQLIGFLYQLNPFVFSHAGVVLLKIPL